MARKRTPNLLGRTIGPDDAVGRVMRGRRAGHEQQAPARVARLNARDDPGSGGCMKSIIGVDPERRLGTVCQR